MTELTTLAIVFCAPFAVLALFAILNHFYRRSVIANFNEKHVFITGTDSGFGKKLALDLDRLGVKVYAGCFTSDGQEKLKAAASPNLKVIRIDVRNTESIEAAKRIIQDDLGPDKGLWGLVNNAGIARGHIFHYTNLVDYRSVMDVNFFGVLNVTEAFSPLVIKTSGRIVNIISILSRCSGTSEPYSCSKFALQPYTDGLRRFMTSFGVKVVSIEPGFFHTEMLNVNGIITDLKRSWNELPQHTRELYGEDFKKSVERTSSILIEHPPLACFNHLGLVTGAIIHALASKRPKTRYVCGLDALFIYIPMSLMPNWISDAAHRLLLPYYSILDAKIKNSKKEN